MTRKQVWVIFCDFTDLEDLPGRTVLDMQVHDAVAAIGDLIKFKRELEVDAKAIHHGFFQIMSMRNPVVTAELYPRLTSDKGRRQFMDYVQSESIGTLIDRDFDTLFREVEDALR